VFALNPQMSAGVRKSRTSSNGVSKGVTKSGGKGQRGPVEAAIKTAAASSANGKAAKGKSSADRKTGKSTSPRKRAR